MLEALAALCQGKRSGEFVAAAPMREFHVFLREGAVAWATDSAEPALFSRLIKERCGIDDTTFSDIVAECRRSRLPLGETLVTLGLAKSEQVREALQEQSRGVVTALARLDQATHVFLERPGFLQYRVDFTFALDELAARPRLAPVTVTPTPAPAAAAPSPPAAAGDAAFDAWGREFLRVRSVDWLALTTEEAVVQHTGALGTATELVRATELMRSRGARFLAYQGRADALIGVEVDGGRVLWCHAKAAGRIGTLASVAVNLGLFRPAAERATHKTRRWKHQLDDPTLSVALEQVLALDPELQALVVETATHQPSLGITSSAQHLAELTHHHRPLFEALRNACAPGPATTGERLILATSSQTLFALREEDSNRQPLQVWVLAGASCSFGIGLASLSVALRNVS